VIVGSVNPPLLLVLVAAVAASFRVAQLIPEKKAITMTLRVLLRSGSVSHTVRFVKTQVFE